MLRCGVLVRVSDREEQPVREVELTALEQDWALGKRVQSDQEMVHYARARVMCAIMEPFLWIINSEHVITLLKGRSSLFRPQGPHRQLQLSIVIFICQIDFRRRCEINQDPRHHGVLRSIRIRPAWNIVQLHQILKVRHFVGVPFSSISVGLDHLLGVSCRGEVGEVGTLLSFELGNFLEEVI